MHAVMVAIISYPGRIGNAVYGVSLRVGTCSAHPLKSSLVSFMLTTTRYFQKVIKVKDAS
jgi:hypothetical protein